jgi:hypothetical protein
VAQVVAAFLWGECVEDAGDAVPEGADGAFGGLSQERLELGEGEFDRVEIGELWRQEAKGRAALFDEPSDGVAFVR